MAVSPCRAAGAAPATLERPGKREVTLEWCLPMEMPGLSPVGGSALRRAALASHLLDTLAEIAHEAPIPESTPRMAIVEKSIEIQAPIRAVHERWRRFDEYPAFLDGVCEVRRVAPGVLHWRARIAGRTREWQAEIVENVPGRRLALVSRGRPRRSMVIACHERDERSMRLMLRLDWPRDDLDEPDGPGVDALRRLVESYLRAFKANVEDCARAARRRRIAGKCYDDS